MHTLFHKYPVCTKVAGTLNHFFSFWCVWSIKPGEGFSRVCNKLWFDRPYISLNTSKHSPNGPLWILPSLWSFVCVCVCVYCKQMCNRSCAFSCLYKTELKETACVCLSLRVSTRLLTSQRSWVVIKKKKEVVVSASFWKPVWNCWVYSTAHLIHDRVVISYLQYFEQIPLSLSA